MDNIVVNYIIPACLAIIMFGMGTALEVKDFKRVASFPKAAVLGIFAQIIILPTTAFGIAYLVNLPPTLAVGIIVLAACAGGPTSNTIAYWARGDLALSVSLTAIGSCITIITIPFIVNLALTQFYQATEKTHLPIGITNMKLFMITLLPVLLGMSLRHINQSLAQKMEKPINSLAAIFLVFLIAGVMIKEKEQLVEMLTYAGPATYLLNLTTMIIGFGLAILFRLNAKQSITISIEVGIQNAATGIFIATTFLNSTEIAAVSAIYTLMMFLNAGIFLGFTRRNSDLIASVRVSA